MVTLDKSGVSIILQLLITLDSTDVFEFSFDIVVEKSLSSLKYINLNKPVQ